jgi:amino acid transporter
MGSIIGSGWLFGAQKGLVTAGPAAIISWVIGGVAILCSRWCTPSSAGCTRCPAVGALPALRLRRRGRRVVRLVLLAAGGHRGADRGHGGDQLRQHYSFAQGWLNPDQTLTTSGLVVAVVLMAIISSINFLGVRKLATTNSAATWWKVGVPLLTIFVRRDRRLAPGNFTAADGFAPTAPRASSPPSRPAGSSSPTSASSRPTSSPARARTPSATSRSPSSARS